MNKEKLQETILFQNNYDPPLEVNRKHLLYGIRIAIMKNTKRRESWLEFTTKEVGLNTKKSLKRRYKKI